MFSLLLHSLSQLPDQENQVEPEEPPRGELRMPLGPISRLTIPENFLSCGFRRYCNFKLSLSKISVFIPY
jgi:hypothetical protein